MVPISNDSVVCRNSFENSACNINIIQVRQPIYSKYLKRKEWFDAFVQLGVFNQSDYTTNSASILGFRLMSHIVRNYVTVNPSIVKAAAHLFANVTERYRIGFHLRMSDNSSDFRETFKMEHFLYNKDVKRVLDCHFIDYSRHPMFYVASDSSLVKDEIASLSNSTVIMNRDKSLHTGHKMSRNDRLLAFQSVLVDVMALSMCDALVVTKGSSLSFLAAAFQGRVPYYIARNTMCYLPRDLTTMTPRCFDCFTHVSKGVSLSDSLPFPKEFLYRIHSPKEWRATPFS